LTAEPVTTAFQVSRLAGAREYLSESRAVVLGIAVAIFGIFLPTVIVPYAYSDDYMTLALVDHLGLSNPGYPKSVFEASAVNGRPLGGLLSSAVFSAAGTIGNLRFVRFFTIVGIVALALLLQWALVRSGVKPLLAALISLFVCSMPPFQVTGSWTVLGLTPYTALLAAGASLLAVAAVDAPRHIVADRIAGATTLLFAALLIGQPAAMFFWVFFAVALVGAVHDSGRALRLARMHFGVAGLALAFAYLMVKLGTHIVGEKAPDASRNALTHDVAGKVSWFFHEPLYLSVNLFDLTPSRWFAVLVAVISTGGIFLALRQQRAPRPLLYIGLAACLVPLCYLPNLVVSENFATFRTQVSLTSLLALYFCLGAVGVWLTVRDRLRSRKDLQVLRATEPLALATLAAFVSVSVFLAAKNVTTLLVEPQITELRMIRTQVAAIPTPVVRVAFVQTGYYDGLTNLVLDDEFGVPSSTPWYTAEPIVLLLLKEQRRLTTPRPIIDRFPSNTTTLPKDEPVVDVRGLRQLR
jgi:hypothetical protein